MACRASCSFCMPPPPPDTAIWTNTKAAFMFLLLGRMVCLYCRTSRARGKRRPGSRVLLVGLLQPVKRLRIQLFGRTEPDLEPHFLVDLRGLQASDRLLPLQTKAKVDSGLAAGLNPGEGPSR